MGNSENRHEEVAPSRFLEITFLEFLAASPMSFPKALKIMFDSNVWHVLEKTDDYVELLHKFVSSSRIEILTTYIKVIENAASPQVEHFKFMKLRLKVRHVPSNSFVLGFGKLGQDLLGQPCSMWIVSGGKHNRDEVIAETCDANGAWLITQEKKRLRNLANKNGLTVYSIEEMLEILAK